MNDDFFLEKHYTNNQDIIQYYLLQKLEWNEALERKL